jgi:NAD-dependent DNA ligase
MEIANKNQQLRELEMAVEAKDQTIERLRDELDKKRGTSGEDVIARKADGKILQVKDRENVCYINLGTGDRVTPGLTFTVYPTSGIPENGEGKAKIAVTAVHDTISECRIVERSGKEPIIPGDLVANVAYDPRRTLTFVVDGQFDLRNRGQASPEDIQEVKLLIQRSGGKVADQVDVQTDFVVLGTDPPKPPQPSESAAETVWAVYQAQLREYNRYQETLQAAKSMHVPVLNTNRFLALIGYSSKATEK